MVLCGFPRSCGHGCNLIDEGVKENVSRSFQVGEKNDGAPDTHRCRGRLFDGFQSILHMSMYSTMSLALFSVPILPVLTEMS